jgi:hypothetical protein
MARDINEQVVANEIDAYLYPIHLPGKAEGTYLDKTTSASALLPKWCRDPIRIW